MSPSGASAHAVLALVGSDGSPAGVGYAARDARRRGCGVHLVGLVDRARTPDRTPVRTPGGEHYHPPDVRELVRRAARRAQALGAAGPVTTELLDVTTAVPAICDRAAAGALLVVQLRPRVPGTSALGPTETRLTRLLDVPLAVVPASWLRRWGRDPRPVSVVVHSLADEQAAVELAREEAARRHTELVTWVTSAVRRGAFVEATAQSQLVVVARRRHPLLIGDRAGPARPLTLAHARCPVLVAPDLPAPVPHPPEHLVTARTTV